LDVECDIGVRMAELASRLKAVAELHQPTHCAVEDIFVSEGLRSALMLGQARGAVLATMGLLAIPVQHFAPTQVKLALTGAGRAQKAQVSEMVRLMLGLQDKPAEDAGDALAIAICSAQQSAPLFKAAPPQKRMSTKSKRDALAALAHAQAIARSSGQRG
jgi:crossover junction endodeoxyribonuclease RuvC